MFRNYLGFASYGFCLRCRLLGFSSFMVWLRIWAFVFCVMTLFNEIVEFLVILVNGQMVGLGNCDRTNAWLPMYPLNRRISSSRSSLMMLGFFFFFFCLNFFLGRPFGFST